MRELEAEQRGDVSREMGSQWAAKERQFQQVMGELGGLEARTKQKALELAKRENKLLQAEDELKRRQQETAALLVAKEEEIVGVKRRFASEKSEFELEKKTLARKMKDKEVAL